MEKYRLVYKDLYYKIKTGEIATLSKLPTEDELAKEYGVSKITVKTALNMLKEEGLVIRKKKLGTVVINGVINGGGERFIAAIFPNFDNLDVRIINVLTQIAKKKKVKISFFNSQTDMQREREILKLLLSENISGIIIMPLSQSRNIDLLSQYAIQKIPVVYMDFCCYTPSGVTVTSDNFSGAYAMVKYLIDKGHQRIGFFPFYEKVIPTVLKRFEGYCQALTDNGIPVNNDYLFTPSLNTIYSVIEDVTKENFEAARCFFDKYISLEDKPTAVVCANDLSAYGLMEVAKEYGVEIPNDLSVTGFDNFAVAVKEGITTVAQNYAEIAKTAILTLLKAMDGVCSLPKTIAVRTVIVGRSSVKQLKDNEQK